MSKQGCAGFAFDPTVTHASELEHNVLFLKLGAPSLEDHSWQVIAPFRAWEWVQKRHLVCVCGMLFSSSPLISMPAQTAIKYDCEGCEYALVTKDNIQHMRRMFLHVDQLNIELHAHPLSLNSVVKLENLELLLGLLHVSHFVLADVEPASCGGWMQPAGAACLPQAVDLGVPCFPHDVRCLIGHV